MYYVSSVLTAPLDFFARSGGGGSSSSGGGDMAIGVAIGYGIGYAIAWVLKKIVGRDTAMIPSIILCVLLSIALGIAPMFSDSGLLIVLGIEAAVGIWIGWSAVMFSLFEKMKKSFKKADTDIALAAQTDPAWDETIFKQRATDVFMRYQQDWSNRDSSHFAEYMTPYYAQHATLMLRALTELKRFDRMTNVVIKSMEVSSIHDDTDMTLDTFTMFIVASSQDQLIDEVTNSVVFTDASDFMEEWTFQRTDTSWQLAHIDQVTANKLSEKTTLKDFAKANSMFYSLDYGWLLIPRSGELVKDGGFGKSDINNHVIGTYHSILAQMYTYSNNKDIQNNKPPYLVGQINLPKSYGGILIRSKKGLLTSLFINCPRGYQKYEFEWPDFNKRYHVCATDADRLAAFELLNPGYMAFLYDNFEALNIEVIDNIVYFYTQMNTSITEYEKLLGVLTRAFKELQL